MINPTGNDAHGKNIPAATSGPSYRIETPAEIALDRARHARAGVHVGTLPYPDRATGALTQQQRDGVACVLCGRDDGRRMLPVGTLSGGDQVVACRDCNEPSSPTVADEDDLAAAIDEAAETARTLFTREHGAAEGIRAYIAFRAALVCVAAGEGDVDEVFAALHAAVRTRDLAEIEGGR